MSGFDARWLDLREPVDHRSRNEELARALARRFADRAIAVLDLGCGTGSNLRATAPLLGPVQHWTLVDHDPALLQAAIQRLSSWADTAECRGAELALSRRGKQILVRLRSADLARDLEPVLAVEAELVTASALFDLASADFIAEVAAAVARSRAAFYTVLTYNGVQRWTPKHEGDGAMAAAFRRHQAGDKGFGAAAGPMAPSLLAAAFDAAGYWVSDGDSGWRLEAGDEALIAELAAGFAAAVGETDLVPQVKIAEWQALPRTGALVGHTDTLALPP